MIPISHSTSWNNILPVYKKLFFYSQKLGLLPYQFDPETLTLSPITSGFSYYFFIFNTSYLYITGSKVLLLLVINWWLSFEFEEIPNGYLFQVLWLAGYFLALAMLYSYAWERKEFAATITASIRLEKEVITGVITKEICYFSKTYLLYEFI